MPQIVILGGGTAGWLTAAYLAARMDARDPQRLGITLVEASDIPTIGVGEATTPSLRTTLADTGLDEYAFMRRTSATFKHGIRFVDWTVEPGRGEPAEYFHPFERPLRLGADPLAGFWLRGLDPERRAFADSVSIQHAVARAGLAPKRFEDKPYSGPMPYAYHLDAGKLAELLKEVALAWGVRHAVGTVAAVDAREDGCIRALLLKDERRVEGDLFVDCSGFAAHLIEKHWREPFLDRSGVLFCDRAVAMQVPRAEGETIRPYTLATAQPSGWIWDIALATRRGTGYVYSSAHAGPEEAEATLRAYNGAAGERLSARHLAFQVGYRERAWVGNTVAVGLAGGFVEPLESTGIHLIEQAAWALAALLPRFFEGSRPQATYNRILARQYDMTIDFVKYHYALTRRRDTAFWRDNADAATSTEWLREKMEAWQTALPDIYDMTDIHSIFDHASYQYVALGMDARPRLPELTHPAKDARALGIFRTVAQALERATRTLPVHDAIIARINGEGTDPRALDVVAHAQVTASTLSIPNNYSLR